MKITLFILLLFTSHYNLFAQDGIKFIESVTIENALALAKKANKNLFIDTYADWCIPCKKMEIEFLNSEVSAFFNTNYVNVRINMDNSYFAQEYRKRFDIVFLPTMIILDQHGNVKYKTDKIMPGRQLLAIANKTLNPDVFLESEASKIERSPVLNYNSSKTNSSGETVVYNSENYKKNTNPEFLYQEAYFRIELMDGSSSIIAQRYLSTQKDWSTPKNLRIIFDFLKNTMTEEFIYFTKNVNLFKKEVGEENVMQTLDFLVKDRLNLGFPRPTFEESQALYKLLDSVNYEQKAYIYYLGRLLSECKYNQHKKMALDYIQKYKPKDHILLYSLAEESIVSDSPKSKEELKEAINYTKAAIELDNSIQLYHRGLAKLYVRAKKKKKARRTLKQALKLATEYNQDSEALEVMLDRIK